MHTYLTTSPNNPFTGFYWQEESVERRWCMKCDGKCGRGQDMVIVDCSSDPTPLEFIYRGVEAQIQVHDTDLCFEVNTGANSISLQSCSSTDRNQRFVAYRGDFTSGRQFEISPRAKLGWCLTQRHHPKNRERVHIEPCPTARKSNTSFWQKY